MVRDESVYDGKSLDDAVRKGLTELGLTRAEVMITVLEEGSGGFLGFGARPYRVRVVPRPGGVIREPDDRSAERGERRGGRGGRDRDRDRGRGGDRGRGRGRDDRGGRDARGPRDARPQRVEAQGTRDDRGGRSERSDRGERGERGGRRGREERGREPRAEAREPRRDEGREPRRDESREPRRDESREPRRDEGRGMRRDEGREPRRDEGRGMRRDEGRDRPRQDQGMRADSGPRPQPMREDGAERPALAGQPGGDADGGRRRRRRRRGGRGRGAGAEAGAGAPPLSPLMPPMAVDAAAQPMRDIVIPAESDEEAPGAELDAVETHAETHGDDAAYRAADTGRMESREPRRGGRGDDRDSRRRDRDRDRDEPREPRGDAMPPADLEREASKLTAELLSKMGYDAEVSAHAEDTRVDVRVGVPDGGDDLTGPKGEVRQALQHVLNRMINRGGGSLYHLQLEVNDFWERREVELRDLARRLADEALSSNGEVVTEYLNSQERRIVHVSLKEDSRVKTYALGTGLIKRVAIAPADFPEPEADYQ